MGVKSISRADGRCHPAMAWMSRGQQDEGHGDMIVGRIAGIRFGHCATTLLIVKIGSIKASATPPITTPMMTIIAGSM